MKLTKETLKQINLLIEMQKCTDKKIGGIAGAEIRRSFVDPNTDDDGWDWYVFKDELEKLKQLPIRFIFIKLVIKSWC